MGKLDITDTQLTLGQYNARAEKIKDKDKLNEFLETVPISMRLDVKRHLQTCWGLSKYKKVKNNG